MGDQFDPGWVRSRRGAQAKARAGLRGGERKQRGVPAHRRHHQPPAFSTDTRAGRSKPAAHARPPNFGHPFAWIDPRPTRPVDPGIDAARTQCGHGSRPRNIKPIHGGSGCRGVDETLWAAATSPLLLCLQYPSRCLLPLRGQERPPACRLDPNGTPPQTLIDGGTYRSATLRQLAINGGRPISVPRVYVAPGRRAVPDEPLAAVASDAPAVTEDGDPPRRGRQRALLGRFGCRYKVKVEVGWEVRDVIRLHGLNDPTHHRHEAPSISSATHDY